MYCIINKVRKVRKKPQNRKVLGLMNCSSLSLSGWVSKTFKRNDQSTICVQKSLVLLITI